MIGYLYCQVTRALDLGKLVNGFKAVLEELQYLNPLGATRFHGRRIAVERKPYVLGPVPARPNSIKFSEIWTLFDIGTRPFWLKNAQ